MVLGLFFRKLVNKVSFQPVPNYITASCQSCMNVLAEFPLESWHFQIKWNWDFSFFRAQICIDNGLALQKYFDKFTF